MKNSDKLLKLEVRCLVADFAIFVGITFFSPGCTCHSKADEQRLSHEIMSLIDQLDKLGYVIENKEYKKDMQIWLQKGFNWKEAVESRDQLNRIFFQKIKEKIIALLDRVNPPNKNAVCIWLNQRTENDLDSIYDILNDITLYITTKAN